MGVGIIRVFKFDGRAKLQRAEAMAAEGPFLELLHRIRAGDETAALALHATYAEQLRRIIRVQLTQPALRRQMDSLDICQSIFADFFVRTALGQYDLQSPTELLRLLATMAHHRVIYHAQSRERRGEISAAWRPERLRILRSPAAAERRVKLFQPESSCVSAKNVSR